MKKIFSAAILFLFAFSASAKHIVGGFISYTYVAGSTSTYHITLKVYRDCTTQTPFDGLPLSDGTIITPRVFVYDNSGAQVDVIEFQAPTVTVINPPIDNPCLTNTSGACVEEGVYQATYVLPSATEGFTLAYVRCCRNNSINNLILPGEQGGTYSAYIPPTATFHNNSPVFNQFPPIFICVNAPLRFDHSATDVDGDLLVYSLCSPKTGASQTDPSPTSPPGPPYSDVNWESGYSEINPLGNNSLAIDGNTGYLTGTPNTQGQFVVGICVSEYRNGNLISTYLRDFQFNVTQCNIPVADIPSSDINPTTGVGTYAINCSNLHVQFKNTSYNPPPSNVPIDYSWDFGVNGITTDVSNQPVPFYDYPDTGTYFVTLIATKGSGPNACIDTTYAFVYIYPTHHSDFSATNFCVGVNTNFTDQSISTVGNVNFWNWDFGDGSNSTQPNPSHQFTTQGTFPVTLIGGNDLGCRDTITKNITIQQSLFVTAGPDTSVCISGANFRDSVQLNASGATSYQWTPSFNLNSGIVQNPIARPTLNTTYVVTGTDASGCFGFDSVTVFVFDPNIDVIIDDTKTVCRFDTAYANVTSQGASNYVWTPNQFLLNPNSYSPGFFPPTSTSYTLTVSNYCYSKSDNILINILPPPTLSFSPSDSICPGNPSQLSVSGAQSYQWQFDNTLSAQNISNPIVTPTSSQYYYVTGIDANGCKNNDSTFVVVVPLPIVNAGNDTLIYIDTKAYLDASTDASKFYWTPTTFLSKPKSLQTSAAVTKAQSYVLVAQNEFGCINSDTIFITVVKDNILLVPTAFSPNGDGVNDVFKIVRTVNIYKLKEFSVWNRWGEKVFETSDVNEGWDGTFGNHLQPMSVYVWQIIAESKDSEEIVRKGNVTLVR